MSQPDYDNYTLAELREVLEFMDKEAYPERFEQVEKHIQKRLEHGDILERQVDDDIEEEQPLPEYYSEPPDRNTDDEGNYIPNEVPARVLVGRSIIAILLIAYSGYGIWHGELTIPLKNSSIVVYETSLWILVSACLCACLELMTLVIAHFDKRDNEMMYYKFASVAQSLSISLFILALIWSVFF